RPRGRCAARIGRTSGEAVQGRAAVSGRDDPVGVVGWPPKAAAEIEGKRPMLRKLLLGTTAIVAMAAAGQVFAAESNVDISGGSDFNQVTISQASATAATSTVTIQNDSDGVSGTPSTINVTQASTASSSVLMDNADQVDVDVR